MARNQNKNRFRPSIENLEDRFLMTANLGANQMFQSYGMHDGVERFAVNGTVVRDQTETSRYQNVVSGDFDGDGRDDLFFWDQTTGDSRMEYKFGTHDGVRSFEPYERTKGNITRPFRGGYDPAGLNGNEYQQVVAEDFDNDGRDDLFFWHPFTGANKLVHAYGIHNGVERFVVEPNVTNSAGINMLEYEQVVVGDFDGDGRDDLFFWNPGSGANRLEYRFGTNDGEKTFARIQGRVATESINGGQYQQVVIGNFDGDNRDDLFFWQPVSGASKFAHSYGVNDEVERFVITESDSNSAGINGGEYTHVVAGNFDGRADEDLFY